MTKKMCNLFVVPLILVCVLSSCNGDAPPPQPFVLVPPDELTQRGHCQELKGFMHDNKPYHYCYYPFKRSDVVAGRHRCSTEVADCINESGECSKAPPQQTAC